MSTRKLIAPFKELNELYFYRTFHMYFNDGIDNKNEYSTLHRILIWAWLMALPFNMDLSINVLYRSAVAVLAGLMIMTAIHTFYEMPKLINQEISNRFSHLVLKQGTQD
jgi:hypothetical protein